MDMDDKMCLKIGPRTGKNIFAGRKIRKSVNGGDMFEDYWTDSDNTINSTKSNVLQATLSYSPSSVRSKSIGEKKDASFAIKPQVKKFSLPNQSPKTIQDNSKKSSEVKKQTRRHLKSDKTSSHFDEFDLDIMEMIDDESEPDNHERLQSRRKGFNCDSTKKACSSPVTSPFKHASDGGNKQKHTSFRKSIAKIQKTRPINAVTGSDSSTDEDVSDNATEENIRKHFPVPDKRNSKAERRIKSTYYDVDKAGVSKHNHDALNEIDATASSKIGGVISSSERKFHESHGAPPSHLSKSNKPKRSFHERSLIMSNKEAWDSIIDDESFWRGSENEEIDSDEKENLNQASFASNRDSCGPVGKKKSMTLYSLKKNKNLADSVKQKTDILPEINGNTIQETEISKSNNVKTKIQSSKEDTYIATENNEKYFDEGDSDFAVRDNPNVSKNNTFIVGLETKPSSHDKNSTTSSNNKEDCSEPREIMILDKDKSKSTIVVRRKTKLSLALSNKSSLRSDEVILSENSESYLAKESNHVVEEISHSTQYSTRVSSEPNEIIQEEDVSKPGADIKTRSSLYKLDRRGEEIAAVNNGSFLEENDSNTANSSYDSCHKAVKCSYVDKNLASSSKRNAGVSSESNENIKEKQISKLDIAVRRKTGPSLGTFNKSSFRGDNAFENSENSSDEKDYDPAVEKKLQKSRVSSKNANRNMKFSSGNKHLANSSKHNAELSSEPGESIIQENEISKPDIVAKRKTRSSHISSNKSIFRGDNAFENSENSFDEKDYDSAVEKKLQKSRVSSKNVVNASRNLKISSGNKHLANSSKHNAEVSSEPIESIIQENEISKLDIAAKRKARSSHSSSNKSFRGDNAFKNHENSSNEKDYDSAVEKKLQKSRVSSKNAINASRNMKSDSLDKNLANSSRSGVSSETNENIKEKEISKLDIAVRRKTGLSLGASNKSFRGGNASRNHENSSEEKGYDSAVRKKLRKSHVSSKNAINASRNMKSSSGNKNVANSSKHNAEVSSESMESIIHEKEISEPDIVAKRKTRSSLNSSNESSLRGDDESYSKVNNSAIKEKHNLESCETAESNNTSALEKEPGVDLDTSASRMKRKLDESSYTTTHESIAVDSLSLVTDKKRKINQRQISKKNKIIPELEENVSKYGRHRYPPLASWRNERFLYRCEEGIIRIVGIDKGTGEDNNALQSLYKQLNKPKIKIKKPKKAVLAIPGQKKLKSTDLIKCFNIEPWEPRNDDSQNTGYHIKTMFAPPSTHFGYLQIEIGQKKPPQYLPNDDLHFTVVRGSVKATIQKNDYMLHEKDMMLIPRNCVYSLKNVGKVRTLLSFARGIFDCV